MAALLASTRLISGILSNIAAFPGERGGQVIYATLTSNRPDGQPLYCLSISGPVLTSVKDRLVEEGFIQLLCEIRPNHATDRVIALASH